MFQQKIILWVPEYSMSGVGNSVQHNHSRFLPRGGVGEAREERVLWEGPWMPRVGVGPG